MKTSYFACPGIAEDPMAVSIARFPPRWWGKRRRYINLAPSVELFRLSKSGFPWKEFRKEYLKSLFRLDPVQVWNDLNDSILLCYERPGENCHRRIVAEWLEQSMNVKILEL